MQRVCTVHARPSNTSVLIPNHGFWIFSFNIWLFLCFFFFSCVFLAAIPRGPNNILYGARQKNKTVRTANWYSERGLAQVITHNIHAVHAGHRALDYVYKYIIRYNNNWPLMYGVGRRTYITLVPRTDLLAVATRSMMTSCAFAMHGLYAAAG